MGCDIHFYVERRVDGVWQSVDERKADNYGGVSVSYEQRFYTDRSYNLFAILADVRNGAGFAGVKTGEGFIPISAPRGVPSDAGPVYLAEVEQWAGDGHSHSYLTVAELLAYDWTQTTQQQGYVSPSEWAVWRDSGKPRCWSGTVSGGGVTHHKPKEFEAAWQIVRAERGYPEQRHASVHLNTHTDEHIKDLEMFNAGLGGARSPYALVTWTEPYYEAVSSSFWAKTMPRLLHLGKPEDVRVVFFFDN